MTEKRFTLIKDTEWWFVQDNTIQVNEFGYRDDLTGEDKYRGLQQDLTEQETVDLLNELYEENENSKAGFYRERNTAMKLSKECDTLFIKNRELEKENKQLKKENKDAWNLIQFIYNEIKEDGYMDWGRIQDLVEF